MIVSNRLPEPRKGVLLYLFVRDLREPWTMGYAGAVAIRLEPQSGSGVGKRRSRANSPALLDSQKQSQRLAKLTGLFFILTYVTSVPPFVWCYRPALSDPAFVLGSGLDRAVSLGALLELLPRPWARERRAPSARAKARGSGR